MLIDTDMLLKQEHKQFTTAVLDFKNGRPKPLLLLVCSYARNSSCANQVLMVISMMLMGSAARDITWWRTLTLFIVVRFVLSVLLLQLGFFLHRKNDKREVHPMLFSSMLSVQYLASVELVSGFNVIRCCCLQCPELFLVLFNLQHRCDSLQNGEKVELRLLNVLYGIQHRTALHHQV